MKAGIPSLIAICLASATAAAQDLRVAEADTTLAWPSAVRISPPECTLGVATPNCAPSTAFRPNYDIRQEFEGYYFAPARR